MLSRAVHPHEQAVVRQHWIITPEKTHTNPRAGARVDILALNLPASARALRPRASCGEALRTDRGRPAGAAAIDDKLRLPRQASATTRPAEQPRGRCGRQRGTTRRRAVEGARFRNQASRRWRCSGLVEGNRTCCHRLVMVFELPSASHELVRRRAEILVTGARGRQIAATVTVVPFLAADGLFPVPIPDYRVVGRVLVIGNTDACHRADLHCNPRATPGRQLHITHA